jgi:two-component system sensor histidine kinase MprB
VLNLLDNAAKWSPADGRVRVSLRQVDSSTAELIVADQGPGIPVEERGLVFERFYRSTSARALPGSGLGLAIVKQVVLKHGGTLRIEDTAPDADSRGTSIHVLLPGRPLPSMSSAGNGEHETRSAGGVDGTDGSVENGRRTSERSGNRPNVL